MLDFQRYYSVAGMEGIAFYLTGYVENEREVPDECLGHPDDGYFNGPIGETFYCDGWCNPTVEYELDTSMVTAVMVGDNREHVIDVDDLTPISDEDFCAGCGQIGCGHG